MLPAHTRILVGYSGGADSTALLHLLLSVREKLNLYICAAHVNHMIRGAESDSDEAHCRAFCEENGIPFFSVRQDVPALCQKNGTGTEETARSIRYDFFRRLQEENRIHKIALAHNAGDSAETILYNLTRGCGADGICGIPPVRGSIIRPLLACKKSDICGYCRENGLSYVTDSTNADPEYARNYIRQKVLPLLRTLNPEADSALLSAGLLLSRDRDALDALAAPHTFCEGRNALISLPDAVLSRVLLAEYRRVMLNQTHADARQPVLSMAQTDAVLSAIRGESPHVTVSLPGKIRFERDRDLLFLRRISDPAPVLRETVLHMGANPVPGGNAMLLLSRRESADEAENEEIKLGRNIYKFFIHALLNPVRIEGTVRIRARMPGDTLLAGGMNRKVRKLMQAAKLPQRTLSSLPVLCDDRGILWIPGFPQRDGTEVTDRTVPALDIYYFSEMQ